MWTKLSHCSSELPGRFRISLVAERSARTARLNPTSAGWSSSLAIISL